MVGLRSAAESVAGWKLSLASALAWLISGLVLLSDGLRHIFDPADALLADLLSWIGLTVGSSLALSIAGLLWLLSVLVGLMLIGSGLYLLYAFGQMVWSLLE